ncbi:MAG: MBL fold metallo-hydrolase [Clostridia bacterium]|nr:MBL fold metallo-hydrolase [Clostridia bacterium]
MKLKYLGTAAAEGFPALFCNCKYCEEARKLGGKNIRTRSQSLVNDDLLIDFPADTYHHFLTHGIEGDRIKYLLITHAHSDHLYPTDLYNRHGCYAHNMRAPELEVFCSGYSASRIGEPKNVRVNVIKPFEAFEFGTYRVTALPARHMPGGEPLFYVIENSGKTLLYAHDTGCFFDEVFDFIEKNHFRFDMLSLDCTNVDIAIPDTGSHMGFSNINRVVEKLSSISAIDNNTVICINHFSHNGNPLHDHLLGRASEYGYLVSYDGFEVEF